MQVLTFTLQNSCSNSSIATIKSPGTLFPGASFPLLETFASVYYTSRNFDRNRFIFNDHTLRISLRGFYLKSDLIHHKWDR
jgi:hypothetical protein